MADTRERILRTADRLFYGQGIRAVGVDTIAAEAGLSKRTLYNHFPSKDALIAAYLQRRFRLWAVTDEPPKQQILRYFDRLATIMGSPDFRGCPFVNAVAEIGESDHPAVPIAREFKGQRRAWLRSLLERMEIADADGLANQIGLLVEGALAMALVQGNPGPAAAARLAAETLIEAATRRR